MLKKWLLWTIICSICMSILLYSGSFFQYTGNKVKLSAPAKIYKKNDYVIWEEKKIKENPNYKNLWILIDINEKRLELIDLDHNEIVRKYRIASGKVSTPSPIGSWKVIRKGRWGKGFGTRFMALNVPWSTFE